MRRYWIPKDAVHGELVKIRGEILHHIRDVCRMHKGSKFEVIVEGESASGSSGGAGAAHLVEIIDESKQESVAQILETRQIPDLDRPHIHLALSVPRFPVFEAVIEKAVELGVKSIQPLFSDFSFIRKKEDVFDKKRPRFEKIITSATQQSGRGERMGIEDPIGLDDFLKDFNQSSAAQGLFAYEGEGILAAKEGLQGLHSRNPQDIWVFVGSEGGFSDREVELFKMVGLKPVTLGSQVLRVETACVALVSIIKYDFDLMR